MVALQFSGKELSSSFFTKVQLIYNIVLASHIQQSAFILHNCVSFLFKIYLTKTLSKFYIKCTLAFAQFKGSAHEPGVHLAFRVQHTLLPSRGFCETKNCDARCSLKIDGNSGGKNTCQQPVSSLSLPSVFEHNQK